MFDGLCWGLLRETLSGGFGVDGKIGDNSMAKHVHQRHNNVSIKIELVTNGARRSVSL